MKNNEKIVHIQPDVNKMGRSVLSPGGSPINILWAGVVELRQKVRGPRRVDLAVIWSGYRLRQTVIFWRSDQIGIGRPALKHLLARQPGQSSAARWISDPSEELNRVGIKAISTYYGLAGIDH